MISCLFPPNNRLACGHVLDYSQKGDYNSVQRRYYKYVSRKGYIALTTYGFTLLEC